MLHIGCHLSAAKGYYAMGKTALSIGADTFQFFTRNPRGSRAKPLDPEDARKLNDLAAENRFAEDGTPEQVFGAPKNARLKDFLSKVL